MRFEPFDEVADSKAALHVDLRAQLRLVLGLELVRLRARVAAVAGARAATRALAGRDARSAADPARARDPTYGLDTNLPTACRVGSPRA